MKKKIKNILKYISGLTLAFGIFTTTLLCNCFAYVNYSLNNYKINDYTDNDVFINNINEQSNLNTSNNVNTNDYYYAIYNIKNLIDNYNSNNMVENLQKYVLTIPFDFEIYYPQANTQTDNTFDINLYYYYTNDLNNFNLSLITNAQYQTITIQDLSKLEIGNQSNYYNSIFNFEIDIDATYFVIGYYKSIEYTNDIIDECYINIYDNLTMLNVFDNIVTQAQYNALLSKYYKLNTENQNNLNTINGQQIQIENKNRQITLLQQELYRASQGDYTFENLFWSIGSVPMAFLLQSFNVNVLGMNIARVITGLITALLLIWLIKRLLK